MIYLPASVRVYLCLTPCDMRKSFDGLHALVREHLELDAFAGHLFVFACRRASRPGGGHLCDAIGHERRGMPAGDHGAGIGGAAERD